MSVNYRFYARLTPGDEVPSVYCGDIDGPNVYRVSLHRWMWAARIYAWWRNLRRRRSPRAPLTGADVASQGWDS